MKRKSKDEQLRDDEAMRAAIARYTGPVTVCPPGMAGATNEVNYRDRAAQWLAKHRNDLRTESNEAKRRRIRMARQQRERIAKHNAPLLKRIETGAGD